MCLFIIRNKKKKKNQKKRNIKSRKIDKRKRKMLVSKHTITENRIRFSEDDSYSKYSTSP